MSLELRSSLSVCLKQPCVMYARRIPRPHPQSKPEQLATNA